MEGKEYYDNQDDDLNSDSKKNESDSDSFGLPDYEGSEGEPSGDKKKEEDDAYSYEDPYSADNWEEDKKEEKEDFGYGESDSSYSDDYGYSSTDYEAPYEEPKEPESTGEPADTEYRSTYYEDEYARKKSPVGWIILIIVVLVAVAVAIFWFLNKDDKTKEVVQQQRPVQPQVTQPAVVEEDTAASDQLAVIPKKVEPKQENTLAYQPGAAGEVMEISDRTNRYYVIVSSSIDDDLIKDYASKLSKEGYACKIL
jgi:hypothetical protein